MMVGVVGLMSTVGYRLAARGFLEPYQRLAAAARADSRSGIPVVFFDIPMRRPSMLYYAGYSPFEHQEPPLLPFLHRILTPQQDQVDVITSRQHFDDKLLKELRAAPGIVFRVLMQSGSGVEGWTLLRVMLPRAGSPARAASAAPSASPQGTCIRLPAGARADAGTRCAAAEPAGGHHADRTKKAAAPGGYPRSAAPALAFDPGSPG
jgi:hypothetical protein